MSDETLLPLEERIEMHLRQMAPHQRVRITGQLLMQAVAELKLLRIDLANRRSTPPQRKDEV